MSGKTVKNFTWAHGVKLVALLLVLGGTAAYAANRYTVGIDTQDTRCLDEWLYVIDTWDKPTADQIRRNDYIAVILTPHQTPPGAKWPAGQVLVKRAVATQPGDLIDVTLSGVRFRHGVNTWTHGTALQATRLLGTTPASYVRSFTLAPGELFVMGDNPLSYDGRYYGPIAENQIVGTVLWAF